MSIKSIIQRIGLEGGAAVKAELDAIGEAGAKAFQKLQDATGANAALEKLGPVFDGVKRKAGEIGKAFGELGSSVSDLGSRIADSAKSIGLVVGSVVAAVGGFVALVRGAANLSQQLENTASAVGVTTKELQNLQFAAGQSGIEADQLSKGLVKLDRAIKENGSHQTEIELKQRDLLKSFTDGKISVTNYGKSLRDLQQKSADTATSFDKLGIATKTADGNTRDAHAVLLDIADAFQKLPDGAKKSGLAMEFFGSRNSRMTRFVSQGSAALLDLEKEAQRVAPALTKVQLAIGDKLAAAFDKLGKASASAKNAFLLLFAPIITEAVNAFTEVIVRNRARLLEFGQTIVNQVTPVVRDLIAIMEGRDKDVKNSFILKARDAMVDFGREAEKAVTQIILPALRVLLSVLELVAKGVNAVFGTEFTGTTLAVALVITRITGLFGILRGSVLVVVRLFGLFAAAVGGVTAALAVVAFAVGFFTVRFLQNVARMIVNWRQTWASIQAVASAALSFVGNFVASVFANIVAGAASLVSQVAAFFADLRARIVVSLANLATSVGGVWGAIVELAQAARDAIATRISGLIDSVVQFFKTLPQRLAEAWAAVVQLATDAKDAIVERFKTLPDEIRAAISDRFKSLWDGIKQKAFDTFKEIAAKARELASNLPGVGGADAVAAGGGGSGFAGGGYVRGSGSSVSDSIRAWLSDREFVVRAKAVDHYGVGFFQALNQMKIPAPSFNMGGIVDGLSSIMPRTHFADGGLVTASAGGGGARPVVINVPGGTFSATMQDDEVERFGRWATGKSLRSAGKKPTWFQG